jgi:hypothetical protein
MAESRPVFLATALLPFVEVSPTAAAASELPIPCLRIYSRSSRGSPLVLTKRRAGRGLLVRSIEVAFMMLTLQA